MASSGDDSNSDNQNSSWWGSFIKSAKEKVYIFEKKKLSNIFEIETFI